MACVVSLRREPGSWAEDLGLWDVGRGLWVMGRGLWALAAGCNKNQYNNQPLCGALAVGRGP